MPAHQNSSQCPCQSGLSYTQCCQPLLANPLDENPLHVNKAVAKNAVAKTAEQLMRSRYSAFKSGNKNYLLQTWHPDFRPKQLELQDATQWIGLQIVDKQQGQANQQTGMVHFRAYFKLDGQLDVLEEISQFSKIADQWLYVNGEIIHSKLKISRNAACPCGSGKKFKRCCS